MLQARSTAATKDGGLHAASAVTLAASSGEPTAESAAPHADAAEQQLQAVDGSYDGSPGAAAVQAEPGAASNDGAAPPVLATPAQQAAHAGHGVDGPQRQSQERQRGAADARSAREPDPAASDAAAAAVTKHTYVDVITSGERLRPRLPRCATGSSTVRACASKLPITNHEAAQGVFRKTRL